jgi:hypothetical protein
MMSISSSPLIVSFVTSPCDVRTRSDVVKEMSVPSASAVVLRQAATKRALLKLRMSVTAD